MVELPAAAVTAPRLHQPAPADLTVLGIPGRVVEAVGLTRTSVTNLEAGRQGDIPATKLVSLAEALDTTVGVLLGETPLDLPQVDVVHIYEVWCSRCGLVQDGVTDEQDANGKRREHVKGHAR